MVVMSIQRARGIKGQFADNHVTNFGRRHCRLLKKYVSISKFSSYLSGNRSAAVDKVEPGIGNSREPAKCNVKCTKQPMSASAPPISHF